MGPVRLGEWMGARVRMGGRGEVEGSDGKQARLTKRAQPVPRHEQALAQIETIQTAEQQYDRLGYSC